MALGEKYNNPVRYHNKAQTKCSKLLLILQQLAQVIFYELFVRFSVGNTF